MFLTDETPEENILNWRRQRNKMVQELRSLERKIKAEEVRMRREALKSLPDYQYRILGYMFQVQESRGQGWCSFKEQIQGELKLSQAMVTRGVRALVRLEFARHYTTFNEDGELNGSGFSITEDGHKWYRDHEKPRTHLGEVEITT